MYEVTFYIQDKRFRVYCTRFDDVFDLITSRFKSIDWTDHYLSIRFVQRFDVEEN